jgi:acyl-coenzyme A thioesterase PaaI-like protein
VAGFVDATKVAQEQDPTSFVAQLDPQWTVFDRPHGGYLVAIMARAAGLTLSAASGSGHVDPLALSAQFLSSPSAEPSAGPVAVRITPLRAGRTVSQVRAQLSQNGTPCVEALLTMGRLDPASEPHWVGEPPVTLPDPADCVTAMPPGAPAPAGLFQVVDVRLDPAGLGFRTGRPDGSGELRGWLSFADDMPPDPLSLLFAADALPPASLTVTPSGWVPTLELSVYVRAVPAPGPLRVRQRARLIEQVPGDRSAVMDETCDVWDARGRLVCQATQLASIRFPA